MPFPWALARFLIRLVAPTVPELVSTVAAIRKEHARAHGAAREEEETFRRRVAEIESTVAMQLQTIEQLTAQLKALHKTVGIALRLAIAGLILSVVALMVLVLRG